MKKLSLMTMAMLLSIALFAQTEETMFGKSGLRLTGAWGGSSTMITEISDDYAVYTGGFGGLEFGRSVFVGWGGYKLINDIEFDQIEPQSFEMKYNGLMVGYAYNAHKPIHPTFMLMGGKGKIEMDDIDRKDNIFVVQPSIGVELNVFRWFHLGLRGGYRMVTDTDLVGLSDSDLSAPFGEVNLKFGFSWGSH